MFEELALGTTVVTRLVRKQCERMMKILSSRGDPVISRVIETVNTEDRADAYVIPDQDKCILDALSKSGLAADTKRERIIFLLNLKPKLVQWNALLPIFKELLGMATHQPESLTTQEQSSLLPLANLGIRIEHAKEIQTKQIPVLSYVQIR